MPQPFYPREGTLALRYEAVRAPVLVCTFWGAENSVAYTRI